MSKNKLSKQIDIFASRAITISPLCGRYNVNSVQPFQEGAQVYNENFRSGTEFANILRLHRNFLKGSIRICNRLFDNYEPSKQSLVYLWSKHFFDLLDASKRVIDEAYNLAYTVGRDDKNTLTSIEKESNPLVNIQRKLILEDGEYDSYKRNMFDWKCSIQSLYVEEQYMKHIVDMCNSRKSKFNPREAKINRCTLRRTITIPDREFENTPQLCILNAELFVHKSKIEKQEKDDKLTIEDVDNYLQIYNRYQYELVTFVFTNFSTLYNETCVQCIKIFLEQQHSIIFNLLQKRNRLTAKKIQVSKLEGRGEQISWSENIDKTSSCITGNIDSCINQSKVVGSLE